MSNTPTLKQQIDELLKDHPEACEAARKRFDTFHDEALEANGECYSAFSAILQGVSFEQDMLRPGSLPSVVASCRDVLVAAAVQARIYELEAVNPVTGSWEQSGWAGLSKDAKGWCRALLAALPPANATADELRDLICAKTLAGLLVADSIPSSPRSVTISEHTKLSETQKPDYDS